MLKGRQQNILGFELFEPKSILGDAISFIKNLV